MPRISITGANPDFNSLFASLYSQAEADMEAASARAMAKAREKEAAKDDVMFANWQAGKGVSDEEILAYIANRIEDYAYDPQLQAEWKKLRIEIGDQIRDEEAEQAFENGGDINDLIRYYRGRLRRTDADSPRARELEDRINALIDKRNADDLNTGAAAIEAQIARGRVTPRDLLRFYRQRLGQMRPGDPNRAAVQQSISDLVAQVAEFERERKVAEIHTKLANNDMPWRQGARQLRQLANQAKNSDPGTYERLMLEAAQIERNATVDAALTGIEADLAADTIDGPEARRRMMAIADKYKASDPATYQTIRANATDLYNAWLADKESEWEKRTGGELENPEALKKLGRFGYKSVAAHSGFGKQFFISQLDDSEFAQTNCVMAAGAMLALSQGIGGLSGGDLRYLTGDRSGGTNLSQLDGALNQVGGKVNVKSNVDFDVFTARIRNGATAVLMGMNANLPNNFKADPSHMLGHGIFIADYDPKKGFLIYNPAIGEGHGYKGEWWPPAVVRNFGWGPAYGGQQFHGDVGFAPANTVKIGAGGKRAPVKFVSVDTLPKRPNTPKDWHGRNHPGNKGAQRQAEHKQGRRDVPLNGPLGSRVQVPDQLANNDVDEILSEIDARRSTAEAMLKAYDAGNEFFGEGRDRVKLTEELMDAVDEQLIRESNLAEIMHEAQGDDDAAGAERNYRQMIIIDAQARNGQQTDRRWNQLLTSINKDMAVTNASTLDPDEASELLQKARDRIRKFREGAEKSRDPLDQNPKPVLDKLTQYESVLDTALDEGLDPATRRATITELLGDEPENSLFRNIVEGAADATDARVGLRDGTMTLVLRGDGSVDAVPARQVTRVRNGVMVRELEPKNPPGDGVSWEDAPDVMIDQMGVPTRINAETSEVELGFNVYRVNDDPDEMGWGDFLTSDDIRNLSSEKLAEYLEAGVIEVAPARARAVQLPPRKDAKGKIVPGGTWLYDPLARRWFRDRLPLRTQASATPVGASPDGTPDVERLPMANTGGVPFPYEGANRRVLQEMIRTGQVQVSPRGVFDATGKATGEEVPETGNAYGDGSWDDFMRHQTPGGGLGDGRRSGSSFNPTVPTPGDMNAVRREHEIRGSQHDSGDLFQNLLDAARGFGLNVQRTETRREDESIRARAQMAINRVKPEGDPTSNAPMIRRPYDAREDESRRATALENLRRLADEEDARDSRRAMESLQRGKQNDHDRTRGLRRAAQVEREYESRTRIRKPSSGSSRKVAPFTGGGIGTGTSVHRRRSPTIRKPKISDYGTPGNPRRPAPYHPPKPKPKPTPPPTKAKGGRYYD